MIKFTVMGKPNCPYCTQAKQILDVHELTYEYIDLMTDEEKLAEVKSMGFKTVPQIWHGEVHIGGYTELVKYLSGEK